MSDGWGNVKGVVIHHTATPDPGSHEECKTQAMAIEQHHRNEGYRDDTGKLSIAYNHLICPHGKVVAGRGLASSNEANGCYKANKEYVALCILGDYPKLTSKSKAKLLDLIGKVEERFGIRASILAHTEVWCADTLCPGKPLIEWVKEYRRSSMALTAEEENFIQNLYKYAEELDMGAAKIVRGARAGLEHNHSENVTHEHPHDHEHTHNIGKQKNL